MAHVRHAVFVVRAFATDKRAAARARELLAQSPGAVAGLVLNTVDAASSKGRGYYGYGAYRYRGYTSEGENGAGRREETATAPTNGSATPATRQPS
jgi:hypothetical protein